MHSSPLPADPNRQADAMLGGCEYQIWQTVTAWLDLRGDERLFVEGAEAFDRVGPSTAEAVQVKASAKPISLGQKGVQEALNNFWALRAGAPHVRLTFRFLTRAPFTVERDKPFGTGIAGLELWNRSSLSDQQVHDVADYLARQERLSPDLRHWLQNANLAQIRNELIRPVVWETQAEDTTFVERNVEAKLIAFAEVTKYVPPASKIKQVARSLIMEVWKVLRQPAPRSLDRVRLLEIWDEATRVSIPQAELDARIREAPPLIGPVTPTELLRRGPPPLPGIVAPRAELVASLRTALGATGLSNLHGSARTGKTTLTKLIVATEAKDWLWWSAARRSANDIRRDLILLNREASRDPRMNQVVLDDLDLSPSTTRVIEDNLGELIAVVRSRRGQVIITSQKPLPQRLRNAFAVSEKQIITVPRLKATELEEFALALGCPADRRRILWARWVHAVTGGHPQLAAVHLFALRDRGWPELTNKTIALGSTAIDAERTDARQLLGELTEPQRLLVFRLSVFPQSFRRDHGVATSGIAPAIPAGGDIFDSLIGPWIEPLHAGYFSVSPLVADAAKDVFTPVEFRALQEGVAEILVVTEPRSTREGAAAFQLVWEAGNEGYLVALTQNWFGLDRALFSALATDLLWFTFVAVEPGEHLFPRNPTLSLALRPLQFQLALSAAPLQAAPIVTAWLQECTPVAAGGDPLSRFMLAGLVLPHHEVPLAPKLVVSLLEEVETALRMHPDLPVPTPLESSMPELGYEPTESDLVSTLALFSSSRCVDLDFLSGFLDALENTESDLRKRILRGFVGGGLGARLAIDRVWLAESDKETANWPRCMAVFERVFEVACTWKSSELATAAVRGIVVVLDEYLKDHAAAHAALDRLTKEADLALHHILDRRASVYFSEGNYQEAEVQWRLALTAWPSDPARIDLTPAFATRSAGISAAKQGHWTEAAKWFLEIPSRLPADETAFLAGAYADAGFAWWKAGSTQDAVDSLIEAWSHAGKLPSGKEDLRAFQTRKSIGHIITWLHSIVTTVGAGDFVEPLPGMCTSGEPREKMRDLPETESAAVWYFLMRIEEALQAGDRAARLGGASVRETSDPAMQAIVGMDDIREAIRSGEVAGLPPLVISVSQAMRTAATQVAGSGVALRALNRDPLAFDRNDALGVLLFTAALLSVGARGIDWQQTLRAWHESLASVPHNVDWDDWLSELGAMLGASSSELSAAIREETNWSQNLIASIGILLSGDASPDDLFIAHSRWLSAVRVSPWPREAGASLCIIVEAHWHRILKTPALIRSPATNSAVIANACANGGPSLEKTIGILEAAAPAVAVGLSDEMWCTIRSLRDPHN